MEFYLFHNLPVDEYLLKSSNKDTSRFMDVALGLLSLTSGISYLVPGPEKHTDRVLPKGVFSSLSNIHDGVFLKK